MKQQLSWPRTLQKWARPFVPPCLRSITFGSFGVLLSSMYYALVALVVSFGELSRHHQMMLVGWFSGWYLCTVYLEIGAIYFICSAIAGMFLNLGDRVEGELSAYSVFNENWQRLVGTMTAEQLIQQQFGGAFAAALPQLHRNNDNGRGVVPRRNNNNGLGGVPRPEANPDGIEVVERVGRRGGGGGGERRNQVHDAAWERDINDAAGGGGEAEVRRRRRRRRQN